MSATVGVGNPRIFILNTPALQALCLQRGLPKTFKKNEAHPVEQLVKRLHSVKPLALEDIFTDVGLVDPSYRQLREAISMFHKKEASKESKGRAGAALPVGLQTETAVEPKRKPHQEDMPKNAKVMKIGPKLK